MNKFIVTTTINKPTEALIKYSNFSDFHLIVVGDKKTPHSYFMNIKNITYLTPDDQEDISKDLSDSIGWNSIRRRNFGFIKAYQMGADIIATVDDDNIPLANWGSNINVGKKIIVELHTSNFEVLDPIFSTEHKSLWHRGFPIQLINNRDNFKKKNIEIDCLVQADFWNGDPDIDAICRISQSPNVTFDDFNLFTSDKIVPFNSQNTFISRELIPHYMMIPHIGRMDDIWGAYYLQQKLKNELPFIVFGPPTVFQERNAHNLFVDLKEEMLGYENSYEAIKNNIKDYLPEESKISLQIYESFFDKNKTYL